MDSLACHVIYVNRSVGEARLLRAIPDDPAASPTAAIPDWRRDRVRELVQPLLDAFGDVHVCATGAACMAKLMQLHEAGSMMDMTPTMVLLDTPHDEWIPESYSHPNSSPPDPNLVNRDAEIHTPDENLYGLALLQRLITEAHLRSISKLVVPIPIISYPETREQMTDGTTEPFSSPAGTLAASRKLIRRCLDLGAVDVLISPLGPKSIATLEICAYKAHRDAARDQQAMMEITKGRKRSWVGINEQKPFAYLREAMVSGLMKGICRLSPEDDHIAGAHIAVSSERQAIIAEAVGRWHFDAHEFSDDELLVAAMQMFKHALTSPELEKWRIPADQLISFLVACRAAYNSFVPYHNFRHVVDVLQATFNFLVHIGSFPPYPTWSQPRLKVPKSPIAALVSPYEALTLLITAIGHDVGHPGVNNGFLTTLNAPLAQLYNDRSVLESFHCAAFSQILRRYWPAVFEDRKMRGLMISSILATDMGLHFDYMKKLATLKQNFETDGSTNSWNGRQLEDAKVLACSLLIKCADISNVARRHTTALKWMHMLSEEFSRQASMEDELEIKSSLMAPPKKDVLSLSNAQLGFMNMFAIPLFQGVAEIMPAMEYAVTELRINKKFFEDKVQEEQSRGSGAAAEGERQQQTREATFSPRLRSFAVENDSEMKHIEISPAPSPSTAKSGHDPHTPIENQDVNGMTFDAVRDLAESDPFCPRPDDPMEGKLVSPKHRTSETTEGSLSAGYPADWASQAASTATGKMTLSPSTQGTSIVSNESGERTLNVPAFNMSPLSLKGSPTSPRRDRERERERDRDASQGDDDSSPFGGSIGRAEGKALKKRPSRFRMKDFPFFKRSKGSSPPFPTADTSG
ncbi:high affinity camp phosphodiesterase [Trichoderma arundinaceum]|uniref:Phosphodiesterase n=1 Tax=Trichoderma arundinaceum TaxID=490622 RepID=A0A395N8R5_TRIAR|nr:high affinity camp phosphodiesterase [Trichoderma arundinaceum]